MTLTVKYWLRPAAVKIGNCRLVGEHEPWTPVLPSVYREAVRYAGFHEELPSFTGNGIQGQITYEDNTSPPSLSEQIRELLKENDELRERLKKVTDELQLLQDAMSGRI